MIDWTRCLALLVTTVSLASAGAAAEPPPPRRLAHDPFDRRVERDLMHQAEARAAAAKSSSDGTSATAPAGSQAQILKAELRAVIAGGARPLVNLGGVILDIGDSIDGLRLVEVRESSAIFTRNGNRVELALGRGRTP